MREQFCTYKIAVILKALEFDEPCFGASIFRPEGEEVFKILLTPSKPNYNKWDLYYPLWQQVIDFLREKYKIIVNPIIDYNGIYHWVVAYPISSHEVETEDISGNTWYDAREKAVLKAIDLILNNKS